MKIKELRKTFERALPYYQQAVDENWDASRIINNKMGYGLCHFCSGQLNIKTSYVFNSHYKDFLNKYQWLFPITFSVYSNHIKKCIKPRLEFLKEEIKRLKKLEKQGYTHI